MRLCSHVSQSLLLVALAAAGGRAEAATAAGRDAHFKAVSALLDAEIRPAAERQIAAFAAAGYPDADWQAKSLRWYYLARFRNSPVLKLQAKELTEELRGLRNELDQAQAANRLPDPVRMLLASSAGETVTLARVLSPHLNPYLPPPASPLPPETVAKLNQLAGELASALRKEWLAAQPTFQSAVQTDQALGEMDPGDPRFGKQMDDAINRRLPVVRMLATGCAVLAEISARGKAFGVDPAPAQRFLRGFLGELAPTLVQWDTLCGDYAPALRVQLAGLLYTSIRHGATGIEADDLDTSLMRITGEAADRLPANQRSAYVDLQLDAWIQVLSHHLSSGTPDDLAQGAEHLGLFRELAAEAPAFQLAKAEGGRNRTLAQLAILGARLALDSGDKAGANELFAQVAGQRNNPAAPLAAQWLALTSETGAGYGTPVTPRDPFQALAVGKAMQKAAAADPTPETAQAKALAALVALRDGAAAFIAATDPAVLDIGPELHGRLAAGLARQGLRVQATVATLDGVRLGAARITKDANPWRTGAAWTPAGKTLRDLAREAISRCADLHTGLNTPASQGLVDEAVALLKKIDPEGAGDLDWLPVDLALRAGSWDRAIAQAEIYLKRHPTEPARVLEACLTARIGQMTTARRDKDEAALGAASRELTALTAEARAKADQALGKHPEGEAAKAWKRVLSAAASAEIQQLITEEKYAEVLARLGPAYWADPPSDEGLRATMLRNLCRATGLVWSSPAGQERLKGLDAGGIAGAWKETAVAYGVFKRLVPGLHDPDLARATLFAGRDLAAAAQRLANRAEALKDPALAGLVKEARQAMADLLEPTIDEAATRKQPGMTLLVAGALWDVDEHPRAVRLYELWKSTAVEDPAIKQWRSDERSLLDAAEVSIANRPELVRLWSGRGGIRDHLEDAPGLQDLIRQNVPRDKWDEDPKDFAAARTSIRALRSELAGMKVRMGDAWESAVEAFGQLEKVADWLANSVGVDTRLAQGYREAGELDKARNLYRVLYAYDPANPIYSTAFIDITLADLKNGSQIEADTLRKARDSAARTRDRGVRDPILWWSSTLQVFELSIALGEVDQVARQLAHLSTIQTDPSRDLIAPVVKPDARQVGDDPRCRRARNALAVELAQRFLDLCGRSDIAVTPSFRLLPVGTGEQTQVLFLDAGAPDLTPVVTTNADGVDVVIYLVPGSDPRPAGSASSASVPAASATAAGTAADGTAPTDPAAATSTTAP